MNRYGIDLKSIPMEDAPDYEIDFEMELEPAIAYIHQNITKKPLQATLVVCTAGMSRSATCVIAYLMKHH